MMCFESLNDTVGANQLSALVSVPVADKHQVNALPPFLPPQAV